MILKGILWNFGDFTNSCQGPEVLCALMSPLEVFSDALRHLRWILLDSQMLPMLLANALRWMPGKHENG